MRRPRTALMTMVMVSRYFVCTQMKTRLSSDRTAAATPVSSGCQWRAAGTISPTTQSSSMMPSAVQAFRGKAPNDLR